VPEKLRNSEGITASFSQSSSESGPQILPDQSSNQAFRKQCETLFLFLADMIWSSD